MEEKLSLLMFHDVIVNQFGLFESYIEPVSNFVFDEWFYYGLCDLHYCYFYTFF